MHKIAAIERFCSIGVSQKLAKTIYLAEKISHDMTTLADNLREKGIYCNFNTLGELQGRGVEIDRLVSELGLLRKLDEILNHCCPTK